MQRRHVRLLLVAAGALDPAALPSELQVDWVRVYALDRQAEPGP